MSPALLSALRRWISRAFVASLFLFALAGWRKGRLVGPPEIRPELLREPVQAATDRAPFSFPYRGKECRVRPVAEYELWGLVVSHNNIHSMADIYHDRSSVDTKDLCVVWGDNLQRDDYLRATFKSGPFTCYVTWTDGVKLAMNEISNNHLITRDAAIRDAIAGVQIGDQVHLKGLLVDYQMEDWEKFWRRTSTTRNDSGCEVVLVEELDVLQRGTPGWYALWHLSGALLVLLPVAWGVVFWKQAGADPLALGQLD